MKKVLDKIKFYYLIKSFVFSITVLTITQNSHSFAITDSLTLARISSLNDKAFEQININPEFAFKYVDSSLALNVIDSISNLEFSNSFTILGILNKNKGFYQIAVANYLRALHFSELQKDLKRVSVCYNNLGVIYYLNGKYIDALSYYKNSVAIEKSIGTQEQLSIRYYNVGEAYQAMNDFDSSLFYFSTSLEIEQELENKLGITYALYGLSNLYLSQKKYDSSLYYMNIITNKGDNLNDLELECKLLITQTELAIYNKSYVNALEHILVAKQLSQNYGYTELLLTSLDKLNIIYEQTGQLSKQIDILKTLKEIQYNRFQNHLTIKISELQKLYVQESQEREIDQLKNVEKINEIEINHSKKVKSYLFFTLFIVILIFIFNIVGLNRLRNRNN